MPPWQPERVWADLARRSGQSTADLEAEIQAEVLRLDSEAHLSFEILMSCEFDAVAAAHLDSCKFCQDLNELMHPPEAVLRAVGGGASAPGPSPMQSWDRGPTRRHLFGMAASVVIALAIGVIGGAQLANSQDPLLSLGADARFSIARTLVEEGHYNQANQVLRTAFERGGLDQPTLTTVSNVLETKPATNLAERAEAVKVATELESEIQNAGSPQKVLALSGRQLESAQWNEGYQSLAAYLHAVKPGAPVTDAFQNRFVAALPEATSTAAEAAAPRQ